MDKFGLRFIVESAVLHMRSASLYAGFRIGTGMPAARSRVAGMTGKARARVFAVMFLFGLSALSASASAASYTDDMASVSYDAIKRYSGLALYAVKGSAADKTALTFAALSGVSVSGYVDYRVNGAELAVASIYSPRGTFVCRKDADTYMGVFQENMGFISGQTLRQAMLLPGTNEIYTDVGGYGKVYYEDAGTPVFRFKPVNDLPAGLVGYGVRICYSFNGNEFRDVPGQRLIGLEILSGMCYEQYAATIPSGAKYVRVEINDTLTTPLEAGGSVPKGTTASWFTSLASVSLSGENLSMGEPEPAVTLFVPDFYLGNDENGRDGALQDDEAEELNVYAGSGGNNSASSKFEGTITSSSKSSRETRGSKSSAPGSRTEAAREAPEPPPPEEPRDETVVYEIRRDDDERLEGAVTVYIVGASGALTLLMMLRRR